MDAVMEGRSKLSVNSDQLHSLTTTIGCVVRVHNLWRGVKCRQPQATLILYLLDRGQTRSFSPFWDLVENDYSIGSA